MAEEKGLGEDLVLLREVWVLLRERVSGASTVAYTSVGVVLSIDGVATSAEERMVRMNGYSVGGQALC